MSSTSQAKAITAPPIPIYPDLADKVAVVTSDSRDPGQVGRYFPIRTSAVFVH
jgi:hypothetical protein